MWKKIAEEGYAQHQRITDIAKACAPYMEPTLTDQQKYNRVKKYLYKYSVTPNAIAVNKAKSGVRTVMHKENGDAIFEGFLELLSGKQATPEDVMLVCNVDPALWKVTAYTCNVWQGQTGAKEGEDAGKTCLWQFKVTLRPVQDNEITFDEVRSLFDNMTKRAQKPKHLPPIKLPKKKAQKMLEINISDLHFAKLSWKPECGDNYDYKIAKDSFFQIIYAEIERLKSGNYEKVLFVWTNDFFNSDNIDQTTTAGTQQNTDIRWQKMFLAGMQMLVDAIELLQQYAPVETFYIASNHCRTTEWYGINYLYAWFRNNKRVSVDLNCKARYYIQYGNNLIGFSHSSYEKKQNLPYLMSVEVPEMWASTTYREFHLAHIHSEKTEEKGGIIFRWLPSVTAADAWHYDSGYIGAAKRSYSFTWDKEDGLEAIHVVHINQKESVA